MGVDADHLKNAYYVSWEAHQRGRSICKQLGIPLYELVSGRQRGLRYAILTMKTIALFFRRPSNDIIIVQNPSIVLALLANIFAKLFGRTCVVDCHNAGITPLDGVSHALNFLAKLSISLSNFSIVTNHNLAKSVKSMGGRPIVLPDPLPDISVKGSINSHQKSVVFICTWASDEPYLEVIKACQNVHDNIKIFVTGNYDKRRKVLENLNLPENIELTGYISEVEFHRLLEKAWVIMDLTTREDCLVCGAYEATAIQKPMILSDTKALRFYFSKGAIYTKNDATSISRSINRAIQNRAELLEGIKLLKRELLESWKDDKQRLIELLRGH